jgi:hypothetical protein
MGGVRRVRRTVGILDHKAGSSFQHRRAVDHGDTGVSRSLQKPLAKDRLVTQGELGNRHHP